MEFTHGDVVTCRLTNGRTEQWERGHTDVWFRTDPVETEPAVTLSDAAIEELLQRIPFKLNPPPVPRHLRVIAMTQTIMAKADMNRDAAEALAWQLLPIATACEVPQGD